MEKITIVDRKSGSRVGSISKGEKKRLNENDPIKREVVKDPTLDEGDSPMDPPEAYQSNLEKVSYDEMHDVLNKLTLEHRVSIKKLNKFEKGLQDFKAGKWIFDKKISNIFSEFFSFFDSDFLLHNRKEEKVLFPLLERRFRETGEHGTDEFSQTPIDIFEDDHYQFIQLGVLTFNLIGISSRLPDEASKNIVSDLAFQNGMELIEMARLHIFREDETLFQLANKLISTEEFDEIQIRIEKVK